MRFSSSKFATHPGRLVVVILVLLIGLIVTTAGIYLWVHRVFAIPGMVYYPGGAFPFGSDNKPVNLGPFYIDAMEVSNADFADFCRATTPKAPVEGGCTPPAGAPDLPVVHVTLEQARAFARWKGKRLPTPQEWERASRGVDALRYPWGKEEDPKRANVLDNPTFTEHVPMPVKSFAATPEYQMAGNVWEMLDGAITPTGADLARFAQLSPPATADEKWTQIRGGSFQTPLTDAVTHQYRAIPERYAASDIGFRCARSLQ